MTRTLAVAVALAGLLPAACGGSHTTPAAAAQSVTTDREAAAAASLVLSDLPPGWTARARGADARSSEQEAKVAACLGVPVASVSTHTPASSDSPTFTSPDGARTIASTVSYAATGAAAHERFAAIAAPKAADCLGRAVQGALASASSADVKLGTPTFAKATFPNVGDETTAYRLELPVEQAGRHLTFVADLVFVRRGRATVRLTFDSTAALPPTEQEQHYTEVVVARVARQGQGSASSR